MIVAEHETISATKLDSVYLLRKLDLINNSFTVQALNFKIESSLLYSLNKNERTFSLESGSIKMMGTSQN